MMTNNTLGAGLLKKAKEMFNTQEEDKDQQLSNENKNSIVWISSLNHVAKEMINHCVLDEIGKWAYKCILFL